MDDELHGYYISVKGVFLGDVGGEKGKGKETTQVESGLHGGTSFPL